MSRTAHTTKTALKTLRGWLRVKGVTVEEVDGAVEHTISKAAARDLISDLGELRNHDEDHDIFFFECGVMAYSLGRLVVFNVGDRGTSPHSLSGVTDFVIIYTTDGSSWKTWTTADSFLKAKTEASDAVGFVPVGAQIKIIEVGDSPQYAS